MRRPLPDRNRRLLRVVWAITLLAVVAGELLPGYSGPLLLLERLHINDKVQHCTAYAVLAFLPALHERLKTVALLALGLVALGVLLEYGQLFSVGRFFEVPDMAANAVGVCAGLAAGLPLRKTAG